MPGLRDYIPSNLRLFASTALGDRSPVDNSYFAPADIAALQQAAKNGLARRQEGVDAAERRAQTWQQLPPQQWAEMRPGPGGGMQVTKNAGQMAQELAAHSAGLRSKPDTVQYEDYPKHVYDMMNEEGWVKGLRSSFTDPAWRAATTIGRARVSRESDGNYWLNDSYDWNHRKQLDAQPDSMASKLAINAANPTTLGNVIGAYTTPAEGGGRPVRINLGPLYPEHAVNPRLAR